MTEEPKKPVVGTNNHLECPDCHTNINVGKVGFANWESRHKGSKACAANLKKWKQNKVILETKRKAQSFFSKPAVQQVPSTVSVPARVQQSTQVKAIMSPEVAAAIPTANSSQTQNLSNNVKEIPCALAINLLLKLEQRIGSLGSEIELASSQHPLAMFSGDPTGCVMADEDAWEKWDGPLNTLLQKDPIALQSLVVRGEKGLQGLHQFLMYLVVEHGISGALLENKIERLIAAIDSVSPINASILPLNAISSTSPAENLQVAQPPGLSQLSSATQIDVIDVDAIPEVSPRQNRTYTHKSVPQKCNGLSVNLPPGKCALTSYPFALHKELGDPWDISISGGKMTLYSRSCTNEAHGNFNQCLMCRGLERNSNLLGIIDRMDVGVNENSPFAFHGVGGLITISRQKQGQIRALKLRKLNDARKLVGKIDALDHHKEWIMAIGSGSVERVDRVVNAALKQNRGILGLIEMYDKAAKKVYKPQYSEEDKLRALLLWRLGGARVADIGYRSLNLPSLRTSRRNTLSPQLIASVGHPKRAEIEHNINELFSLVGEISREEKVTHLIVGFDEIKTDKRARVCERTNNILGPCREHAKYTSLQYTSRREVDMLVDHVKSGKIHLATNATIGALGLMSANHRLYSALPVLISGQCGQETGREHASVIQTVLDSTKTTKLRTISVASDGESRRGEAFVILTMKRKLDPSSSIYPLLAGLSFMNLEVGDDDLTCDKDYKHVFKRLRNLLVRQRGLKVHGIHIMPNGIRMHLEFNKVPSTHINSILDPNDKQDVKLAYDLLHAIWSLPALSENSDPGFFDTREAFRTLGMLFRHILLPYICVDLTLSEQLIHLSAAAHMVLAMVHEDHAGTLLMPTQLLCDIMHMIKNVFFCAAKVKIDDPMGSFYMILLGTDRLESLFGILRTMVGNDSSVDILQLVLRLGGTTEVSGILAQHPEWDRSPRRLNLPVLSKDGFDLHKSVDHVTPASWRGDVTIAKVNLETCWKSGRDEVIRHPRLGKIIQDLEDQNNPDINILQPFGKDIVRSKRDADDYDDTAEDFNYGVPLDEHAMQPLNTTLEDAAIESMSLISKHDPCFEIDGIKIWKSRYLSERFKELNNPGTSSDRLKRYADIPRYAIKNSTETSEIVGSDEEPSDKPVLKMHSPIATVLKCDGRLFVCVGEVNDILNKDSKHTDMLSVELLGEPSVRISFQLLFLVSASIEDDPSLKNDWRWSRKRGASYTVPGGLILPVNPDISTKDVGRPCYLFSSQILRGCGSVLLERLTRDDVRQVPVIQRTHGFPYREKDGKACFVCDDEKKEQELLAQKQCPRCNIDLPSAPQRVLEHMAAHILHDPMMHALADPCGLCLRSGECVFYLRKGKGANASPRINYSDSSCANKMEFSYSVAAASSTSSPCSNVPIKCPYCNITAPAVWRYNMQSHISSKHPYVSLAETKDIWDIGGSEKYAMKNIWKTKSTIKKTRKSKAKSVALVISEAHSSRLTLSEHDSDGSEGGDDLEGNNDLGAGENALERDDGNISESESIDQDEWYTSEDAGYNPDYMPASANYTEIEGTSASSSALPVPISETDVQSESPLLPQSEALDTPPDNPSLVTTDELSRNPEDELSSTVNESGSGARLGGRRGRKRRRIATLHMCTCEEEIFSLDDTTITCKKSDCETRWFHLECMGLDHQLANWRCEACQDDKGRKRRRC